MSPGLLVMPLSGVGWRRAGDHWSLPDSEQQVRTFTRSTVARDQIKERWERKLKNKAKKQAAYKVPFREYHSHAELEEEFAFLAREFSQIAQLFSIGRSVEGREILALKISSDVSSRSLLKPQVKFTANIHGNEVVGRELLIALARSLCEQHSYDKEVTSLLDRCELQILPSLNPDGFSRRTRNNTNNKDLNRSFPDWANLGQDLRLEDTEDREPEVAAVIKHVMENRFVLSVDYHDGMTTVTFPWDDSPACTDQANAVCSEDHVFYELALTYAYNHAFMYTGQCPCHPEPFSIGNYRGEELEVVSGGLQDFTYLFSNAMELTVEVSCCKRPPITHLSRHWRHNYHAMLAVLRAVEGGVRGLVLDSLGNGVAGAQVMVEGVDKVTVTSERGEYWRLLLPGLYRIVCRSGLTTGTAEVLVVQGLGGGAVRADIRLEDTEDHGSRQLG